MKSAVGLIAVVLACTIVVGSPLVRTPAIAQQSQPDLQGLWRNAESTVRITVKRGEVRAEFVDIGATARTLGFKPGEVSLIATQRGGFLFGEQTIRFGANQSCYKDGRKIPVIGRVAPDGQGLALHNYTVIVGPDCRDTGAYTIVETLWQRTGR
jgi:hypothetical protein